MAYKSNNDPPSADDAPRPSPDEKLVAIGSPNGELWVVGLGAGKVLHHQKRDSAKGHEFGPPEWSSDGKFVSIKNDLGKKLDIAV